MNDMWEDERAPGWRRRVRAWTIASVLQFAASLFCVWVVVAENSGWALLAALAFAVAGGWATAVAGTYRGRLERPARKAAERAARAGRRERAVERGRKH